MLYFFQCSPLTLFLNFLKFNFRKTNCSKGASIRGGLRVAQHTLTEARTVVLLLLQPGKPHEREEMEVGTCYKKIFLRLVRLKFLFFWIKAVDSTSTVATATWWFGACLSGFNTSWLAKRPLNNRKQLLKPTTIVTNFCIQTKFPFILLTPPSL